MNRNKLMFRSSIFKTTMSGKTRY
uniref:Uncharacterized protein n=1 Tax=Anopheles arabiensis TaxID=7173 RepID=A0A182IGH6_ANOAR